MTSHRNDCLHEILLWVNFVGSFNELKEMQIVFSKPLCLFIKLNFSISRLICPIFHFVWSDSDTLNHFVGGDERGDECKLLH